MGHGYASSTATELRSGGPATSRGIQMGGIHQKGAKPQRPGKGTQMNTWKKRMWESRTAKNEGD
jgi:hypothetical protein